MENKRLKILLFISSQKTPRIYLILLKRFLEKEIPNAIVNYFISSHDSGNETAKKSVYAESEKLKKDVDVLIGLDGDLPKDLLKNVKVKKYLLHLPDAGCPEKISSYVSGYDHLVVFDKKYIPIFETECRKKGVKLIVKAENPFEAILRDSQEMIESKKILIKKHPELVGKRILAITTRGVCDKKYIEKYKSINLRTILKKLPDDVVLMTNCPQLELASSTMAYKYTGKFIVFGQRELIDVLTLATWNFTNIGLSEYSKAIISQICYSGNDYEKQYKKTCVKLWENTDIILSKIIS